MTPSMPRFYVLFNARSGTAQSQGITAEQLQGWFREAGVDAEIDADYDADLQTRVARALASEADFVVAAGGDGTATALAGQLSQVGRAMALLPFGTANLLARDLGLALDPREAVMDLMRLLPRTIDIGTINGRFFLHNVEFGFAAPIAEKREAQREDGTMASRMTTVSTFFHHLASPRRLSLVLSEDGPLRETLRVRSLVVALNDYREEIGSFFAKDRLDGGAFTIFAVKRLGALDAARMLAGMAIGRWKSDRALQTRHATRFTLESRKSPLKAMIDGEVVELRSPFRFEVRPGALTILAPPMVERSAKAA